MEVFKPIKVENYQFMKNGLKMKGILWREYGYEVAIIKEGFRNFDLKKGFKKQERRKSKRKIER